MGLEGPAPDCSGWGGAGGWLQILPISPKSHLKPKNVKFTRTDLKLLANKINFHYFL